ncbi:MAG TPA: hypothetical protein VGL53_22135, partial [Bryobacteraceae bacterium]
MRQCLALGLCSFYAVFGQDQAAHVLAPPAPVIAPEPIFGTPAYVRRRFYHPSTIVNIEGPKGLRQYVADGKLRLNLRGFLGLTLDNNYDIQVQQLSVQFSENAITRAFAVFDPTLITSYADTRQKTPSATALAGAATLDLLTEPFSIGVTQEVPTGATYSASFGQTRSSTNSSYSLLNPVFSTALSVSVNQPLLRGRGAYITKLPITLARSRLNTAQASLENQVLQLIVNAEQ